MTSPGSFTERLQLVVDATTAGGEAGFARLTGVAKEADRAATDAGESVAKAADRVAAARQKEADAAGAVRVAEQRLVDLREKGITSGTQYVAAEEKLETARRRQHSATSELENATEAATRAEVKAAGATDKLGDSAGRTGLDLKELGAKAAGLVAGVSLADWAHEAFTGFTEGARGAGLLATSMNATTEQAGAFLTLVGTMGLELNDLLEIQAEFATKTKDGLTLVGTELQHNADGTVNWTTTLEDTLGALQKVPDATERNRLGFAMFGEEGYKQLSRLVSSGVDVRDALAKVGTPFDDADVAAVADFDAKMLDLSLSSGELGRTLGRNVIPLVTGLVNVGQDLAGVIGSIPLPIAAATAAAILLGQGVLSTAGASDLAAVAIARVNASIAAFRINALVAGSASAIASAGIAGVGLASSAASKGLSLLGGPLGVALIGAGVAFHYASEGADDLKDHAHKAALSLLEAEQAGNDLGPSLNTTANELEEHAGYWERSAAYVRGYESDLGGFGKSMTWLTGPFQRLTMGFGDTADTAKGFELEIQAAKDELGAFGAQGEIAQVATRSLNDLIAEGTIGGAEFADAVRKAAEAQGTESRTSDIATASIAAYNATTRDAIATMLDLYKAQLGQRSGWQDVLTALQDTAGATEDNKTAASEVEQAYIDLIGTVLDYAGSSADAAVEAARAAGTVLDPLSEAKIRAEATMTALKKSLDAPNLTERARAEIQTMIDQLTTAQDKGDIHALLTLTGGKETADELDTTTADRDTVVNVESRGGPAVDEYLDRLTNATRLALVRVESRGGPDVRAYLEALADSQRLAIIRVESRGGPAVATYLDGIAATDRLAIIRVETRGGPDVQRYLDSIAGARRIATIEAQGARGAGLRAGPGPGAYASGSAVMLGSVTLDLELTGRADRQQLSAAQRGSAYVRDVKAYERENGTSWRRSS